MLFDRRSTKADSLQNWSVNNDIVFRGITSGIGARVAEKFLVSAKK